MNYGDKHTEDSLSSRLGRLYGIERGLDCGPNIIMDRYWKIWDGGERQDRYSGCYEADFEKGAGLIVDGYPITTILKPKVRKEVKPLTDNGYIHYLRLFANKWVRKRELTDECNIK